MLQTIRDDAKRERFDRSKRGLSRFSVRQDPGKIGDLSDPASIIFAVELDGEPERHGDGEGNMRDAPTAKAVQAASRSGPSALLRIGWRVKRIAGSHRVLERPGWPDYVFAFHDGDEIGPVMLSKIAKRTGLRPADL